MQSTISTTYLGLGIVLTAAISPSPSPGALERDEAGARVGRILQKAMTTCAEVVAVAMQDVLRDAITAAALERRLPVIRVEVGEVGRTLDARVVLSDLPEDATDEVRTRRDEQLVAVQTLLSEFAVAAASQE